MSYRKIHDLIARSRRILLATHVNPDFDAVCSELALAEYLRSRRKTVSIVHEKPVAGMFSFLPGVRGIKTPQQFSGVYDLLIILDCGERSRMGGVQKILRAGKPVVNIDHHYTSDHFGDAKVVCPEASSTAEVLFEMFAAWGVKITKKIAQFLYLGIMTDTGSFRYQNTTPRAHAIASRLLSLGLSAARLYRMAYEDLDLKGFRALGQAVNRAKYFKGDKIAVIVLSRQTLGRAGGDVDLKDKIFHIFRLLQSVQVIVIFSEISRRQTRVNLRSTGSVNVAAVARRFGGGGHKGASGCVLDVPLKSAVRTVVIDLQKRVCA